MLQTLRSGQQMTMVGTICLGAIPPWPHFAGFAGLLKCLHCTDFGGKWSQNDMLCKDL